MTTAAAHARHLSLLRIEQAARQAFGFADETARPTLTSLLLSPRFMRFWPGF